MIDGHERSAHRLKALRPSSSAWRFGRGDDGSRNGYLRGPGDAGEIAEFVRSAPEFISSEIAKGCNATAIYQDLVEHDG